MKLGRPISERGSLARAISSQHGISLKTIRHNHLLDLPEEARLIMIGQIQSRKDSLAAGTVAKKRRGSLSSLGMATVYRRRPA